MTVYGALRIAGVEMRRQGSRPPAQGGSEHGGGIGARRGDVTSRCAAEKGQHP